jgi:hypothetical protein
MVELDCESTLLAVFCAVRIADNTDDSMLRRTPTVTRDTAKLRTNKSRFDGIVQVLEVPEGRHELAWC